MGPVNLRAARAGARSWRTTQHRSSLFAYDRRLLHPQLLFRRDGHVFGRSQRACVALRGVRFSKDFAFRRLKMRKKIWPRRGARSQGSELALQTRKNRPPAELGEPAERLASCSRSKKSATYALRAFLHLGTHLHLRHRHLNLRRPKLFIGIVTIPLDRRTYGRSLLGADNSVGAENFATIECAARQCIKNT